MKNVKKTDKKMEENTERETQGRWKYNLEVCDWKIRSMGEMITDYWKLLDKYLI